MTKKKTTSSPSWIQEVTPDDEVMRAFYLGQSRKTPDISKDVDLGDPSVSLPSVQSSEEPSLEANQTISTEEKRTEEKGREENNREEKSTAQHSTIEHEEEKKEHPQKRTEEHRREGKSTEENTREENKEKTSPPSSERFGNQASQRLKVISKENSLPYETPTQPRHFEEKQQEDRSASVFRDFNKRPNSIERDAVPKGLFLGSTKVLYDVLFFRTRGAMPSVRKLQITSAELCKLASMSDKTLWKHLRYLEAIGLVVRLTDSEQLQMGFKRGAGNVFEVFIPEEIDIGKAQKVAATGKIWKQAQESFPQQNSREEYGTAGKNLPGTVGKNLPYPIQLNPNESIVSERLIHDKTCIHEEESAALEKLSFYLSDLFAGYLGRELTIEERLGIIATLTEELLDIVHQGLQGNANHGREIENTVAWFTSMIGQRLSGRNRKRTPEEALRGAVWVSLRELERRRGGKITAEERGEIETELIASLTPRFTKTVPNAGRFIKEHITNWWLALDKTRSERKEKK